MIGGDAESELERVDLRCAELDDLNLPNVCFAHANLDGAVLRRANLSNATLLETTLRNTNLADADLREADFTRALLDGAILCGADLSTPPTGPLSLGALLLEVNLTRAG